MQHETTPHWQNVGDTLCASGESPFWHAQEERLYWVDTLLKRVWRHHPASGRSEHWDFPEPAKTRCIACLVDTICFSKLWKKGCQFL